MKPAENPTGLPSISGNNDSMASRRLLVYLPVPTRAAALSTMERNAPRCAEAEIMITRSHMCLATALVSDSVVGDPDGPSSLQVLSTECEGGTSPDGPIFCVFADVLMTNTRHAPIAVNGGQV